MVNGAAASGVWGVSPLNVFGTDKASDGDPIYIDENGQLLTGTFMDYHLPTALDVPSVISGHTVTTSPLNPLGVKGCGEAGAIGSPC